MTPTCIEGKGVGGKGVKFYPSYTYVRQQLLAGTARLTTCLTGSDMLLSSNSYWQLTLDLFPELQQIAIKNDFLHPMQIMFMDISESADTGTACRQCSRRVPPCSAVLPPVLPPCSVVLSIYAAAAAGVACRPAIGP